LARNLSQAEKRKSNILLKKTSLLLIIILISQTLPAITLPDGFIIPAQDMGGIPVYSIKAPDDPMIQKYINDYSTAEGQKTMSAVLNRGAPYLGFLYNRLIEADMPPELMYLPAIESGFRAWAVSHSGAAGFWQFMMNSISPYDIDVNEWQDDRRDFWKATEAAVKKLELNYKRTGSWTLAVAAYNCGLGRVERAVASSGSTDYMELYRLGLIPLETRNYVPKFFAFAKLAMQAEYSRITAARIIDTEIFRNSDKWERIELNQAVNLVILASKTGIPVSLLHEANAELRHGITPPASNGYFLKVPAIFSDNVMKALKETKEPLMRFYIHEIQSGDTFYALSRHFGVPVSMIAMYNPAADAKSLRSGQKIIIPALKEVEPYRSGYEAPKRWNSVEAYTISTGDTLWGLARRFNTSVEELTFNNSMSANETLRIGMIIQVPQEF
jgi:membrane-bound lytic murein transglycosylase D